MNDACVLLSTVDGVPVVALAAVCVGGLLLVVGLTVCCDCAPGIGICGNCGIFAHIACPNIGASNMPPIPPCVLGIPDIADCITPIIGFCAPCGAPNCAGCGGEGIVGGCGEAKFSGGCCCGPICGNCGKPANGEACPLKDDALWSKGATCYPIGPGGRAPGSIPGGPPIGGAPPGIPPGGGPPIGGTGGRGGIAPGGAPAPWGCTMVCATFRSWVNCCGFIFCII